jgi:hypothetical protein
MNQSSQDASPTDAQITPNTQSEANIINGISHPDSVAFIRPNGSAAFNGQPTPSDGESLSPTDGSNQNSSSISNLIFVPIAAVGAFLLLGFTAKFVWDRKQDSKAPNSQLPDLESTSEASHDQAGPDILPHEQKTFSFPSPPALPPNARLSVVPIEALYAAHRPVSTVPTDSTWDPMPLPISSPMESNWSQNLNAHSNSIRPSSPARSLKRETRSATDAAVVQKHTLKAKSSAKNLARKHRAQPQFPARKNSSEPKVPSPLSR